MRRLVYARELQVIIINIFLKPGIVGHKKNLCGMIPHVKQKVHLITTPDTHEVIETFLFNSKEKDHT